MGSLEKAARAMGVPLRKFAPENGESWEDVHERAKTFLEKVVGENLVIV